MGKETERITRRSIVLRGIIAILDRVTWFGRLMIGLSLALAILIVAVNFKGCAWGDFTIFVDDEEECIEEQPPIEINLEQRPAPGANIDVKVSEDGREIEIRKGGPVPEEPEEF